jgi:hypothetical protein
MFAYSSRRDLPIRPKLGMLMHCNQKEISGRSKLRRTVLGSSPGEGVFCISETKQDRKTAPRPKMFVSASRLQEHRLQLRKSVLGSSPGEDSFYSSETRHERRTAPRPKLFVSSGRLQEQRSRTRKLSWVLVMLIIFPMIINDTYEIMRPMTSFRAIKIDKICKHLSNFPAATARALC